MRAKIFLGLLSVSFDGIVEDGLIVRGRGGCNGGLGHGCSGSVFGKPDGGEDCFTDGTDTKTRCR